MPLEIGRPVPLGGSAEGGSFSVPAVQRSSAGRITATGTVVVVVASDGEGDDIARARQLAAELIAADPGLLTRVDPVPRGRHGVERTDGGDTPWGGPGFLDPPDDDPGTDKPRRILSPDSPQTGG